MFRDKANWPFTGFITNYHMLWPLDSRSDHISLAKNQI